MAGVKKSRLEVLIGIIILCEIVLPTTAIAPCSLEPSEDNCKIVGVKCNRELKVCECWDNRIFTATGTCSNNTSAKNRTVACKFYKDCRDACMESPCGSETETVSENSSKAPEKVYVNRGGLGFSEWVIIAVIAAIVTCATITSLIVSYRFYFSRIVDCRRFVEGSEDMEMNNQNPEAVVSPPGDILTREDMGTVRDAVIAANVTTTISFLRASEIEDMSSSIITNIHKVSEGKFSNVHIGELQLHSETDETTNELQLHSETDETTKTRVLALKEIKCDYDSESVKCTLREVECMRMVNHVNLIRLTGFFNRGVSKLPWIVFDYVKYGSLKDVLLDSNTRFPQLKREEPHVITEIHTYIISNKELVTLHDDFPAILHQIACGMEHLHANQIVHGDLATRNVLIGEENQVKIADFGLSRVLHAQDHYETNDKTRFAFPWMAREVLVDQKLMLASDVWSFGVLLWEMATFGGDPFIHLNGIEFKKRVQTRRDDQELLIFYDYISETMREMMMKCWRTDPLQRETFTDIKTFYSNQLPGGLREV